MYYGPESRDFAKSYGNGLGEVTNARRSVLADRARAGKIAQGFINRSDRATEASPVQLMMKTRFRTKGDSTTISGLGCSRHSGLGAAAEIRTYTTDAAAAGVVGPQIVSGVDLSKQPSFGVTAGTWDWSTLNAAVAPSAPVISTTSGGANVTNSTPPPTAPSAPPPSNTIGSPGAPTLDWESILKEITEGFKPPARTPIGVPTSALQSAPPPIPSNVPPGTSTAVVTNTASSFGGIGMLVAVAVGAWFFLRRK